MIADLEKKPKFFKGGKILPLFFFLHRTTVSIKRIKFKDLFLKCFSVS